MHFNLYLVIVIAMVAAWCAFSLYSFSSLSNGFGLDGVIRASGVTLIAIGGSSLMAMILSSTTGLWKDKAIEWPTGYSNTALPLHNGGYAVAHRPSGRIQIYDSELEFVAAAGVDAGGGIFTLYPSEQSDQFFVYTSRGRRKLTFSVDGALLADHGYTHAYPEVNPYTTSVRLPIPLYAYPLASPLIATLFVTAGLLLAYVGLPSRAS